MRAYLLFFVTILLLSFSISLPQQNKIISVPPIVSILPNSNRVITFAPKQKDAINAFLKLHPDLDLLILENIDPLLKSEYLNYYNSGKMQYQYACWGDFDNDKVLDVVVIFKSKKVVNTYNWHTFNIVLLKGREDGNYSTMKIHSFNGGCLDVILFHKKEKSIEFYCSGVASGTIKWEKGQFIVKDMVGD